MDEAGEEWHAHPVTAWPFAAPTNAAVFSSSRVIDEGLPILMAYHDHDGDWQFHHGYLEDGDECRVACFGCMFEGDRSIGLIADLPVGWCATREAVGTPWHREPFDRGDEEAEPGAAADPGRT